MIGVTRQCDERLTHARCPGWCDGCAVAGGATTTNGLESVARGQIDDECSASSIAVDGTQTRREPRDAVTGVGRPIERIEHHRDRGIGPMTTRFLRQHTDPGTIEHLESGRVGSEIAVVLTGPCTCESPVVEIAECRTDGGRSLVEDLTQDSVVHHVDGSLLIVAIIDVPGFVADLKDHAVDHAFHVHDERHFIETYSMRQAWEIDLHPEDACGGPLDLHLALEVDPRIMIGFEDRMLEIPEGEDPVEGFSFPLAFTWTLPPLRLPPDLLVLATDLAGLGGIELPLEVSAIDSFASVTDAAERSLTIVSRIEVGLDRIYLGQEQLCDVLDTCHNVSSWLLDRSTVWLGED